MHTFSFATTPKIHIVPYALTQDLTWLNDFKARHIFIVSDKGLAQTGLLTAIEKALKAAQKDVTIFTDVEADPPEEKVLQAVAAAKSAHAELIMGIGGGSSLDTAKLVALLACTEQALTTIYGIGLAQGPRLPLIQVPTTAGTGSEVTPIAIVTTPSQEKKGVVSPLLYPDLAILDASLTVNLPPAISAMTGIDAMVHAIEAYTSKIKKNPLSDALAKEALALMYRNLPLVLENGQNLEARSAMLIGAMMAGMAFANAPVAAVHALAYPLGGHFHVPHGLSNALVLAPVLRHNAQAAQQHYAELAQIISPTSQWPNQKSACDFFIESMTSLVKKMPFAQTLSAVGVQEHDIDLLANDALKIERLLMNNPCPINLEEAKAIYRGQLF